MDHQVIQWLLGEDNASVRYRTLTELLDKPLDKPFDKLFVKPFADKEAQAAYTSIWQQKAIQKIFSKQKEDGIWDTLDYGMHTSMRYLTALAEHGLHTDRRIDKAVDLAVGFLYDKQDVSDPRSAYDGCSDALVLRAIVMLGYHDREDVREMINKYVSGQAYDGGFICKRLLKKRPGRKSCFKAAVAGLLLYAECRRKGIVFDNTDHLLEYFLKRDVFYRSDKSGLVAEGRVGGRYVDNFFPVEPMRIGLPLTISALCILGTGNDERMQKAWSILESKKIGGGKLMRGIR